MPGLFRVSLGIKLGAAAISRHYSRAIWTSVYRFWTHVVWAPKLKICIHVWKKNLNSLYIMITGRKSTEISIMRP